MAATTRRMNYDEHFQQEILCESNRPWNEQTASLTQAGNWRAGPENFAFVNFSKINYVRIGLIMSNIDVFILIQHRKKDSRRKD